MLDLTDTIQKEAYTTWTQGLSTMDSVYLIEQEDLHPVYCRRTILRLSSAHLGDLVPRATQPADQSN